MLLLSTKSLHDVLLTLFFVLFVLYNLHTDADKGFNSVFPTTFNDAGQFDCSKHKGENLVKHGTKGDKEVYEKAIHAKSTLELQHLKRKYSSKGAAYLVKTPDDRLYLVSSGPHNCGKTLSQMAESLNAAIFSVHAARIATGLLWFFE